MRPGRRSGARIVAVIALALVAGFSTNGCGYSTRSLFDPDIGTVAIDVFENTTFRRDLELALTRRVAAEVRQRTRWRIASRGRADAVITGRLLAVLEVPLSETRDDLVLESSVRVDAQIRLQDRATGAILRQATRTSSVAYLQSRGESLETALDRSLSELAEDLVQALETWAQASASEETTTP